MHPLLPPQRTQVESASSLVQKFNLTTTTLLISEAQLFNEPISPPSSTPSSPPYYNISSDSDQSEPSDPQSPTLTQLQAHAISAQNPSELETTIPSPYKHPTTPPFEPHTETPFENPITQPSDPPTETIPVPPAPISPTSEPEPSFPTLEEAIALFSKSSMEKIISLSENSRISDDPSVMRIH
ncbi:proline-rich receptor-like protein kinase PERK8 [Lathyrus oleraceus]|uniref:proline-rich receptor-like protein kinase PERK8 n=1 Tax=Pisum sativum TaxID=3888 RepID=UPI0021CF3D4B|nr:proline-rich receptor-like protein kinase PERK8 [Pisum sativum]